MAGGLGTRMRPYTTVLPKPLLPVGDRPVLAILLDQLAAAGARRIDLCVGYLGELIRAYLAGASNLPADGTEIVVHDEPAPLGTAGALRDLPGLGDDGQPFLVLNGDVLTSLDFAALLADHVASGAALTVAAQMRRTQIGSGVLQLDPSGRRVAAYVEKPVLTHRVSLGIYALDARALALLPPSGRFDVPQLVDALIEAGEPVGCHDFDGPWFDVGTPADHEAATQALLERPERYLPPSRRPTGGAAGR